MNKIYDQCWESREEYALDISLFKEFWDSIKEDSFEFIMELFEIKLKGKISTHAYSKLSWERMSKYVFYEDIEFAKKQLEFYRDYDRFYSMQLEELPLKVKRGDLIVKLLEEKFKI